MKQVEIFTAGCPICNPVVNLVNETAGEDCEIIVYDLVKQCEEKTCIDKMNTYKINRIPSIVVDGRLLDCCDREVTKQDLANAGIGV